MAQPNQSSIRYCCKLFCPLHNLSARKKPFAVKLYTNITHGKKTRNNKMFLSAAFFSYSFRLIANENEKKAILKLPVTSHRREVARRKKYLAAVETKATKKKTVKKCSRKMCCANRLFYFCDSSNKNSYHLSM